MISEAQDWLPPTAMTHDGVCDRLAESVAAWSRAWFGHDEMRAREFALRPGPRRSEGAPRLAYEGKVVLAECQSTDAWRLAQAALHASSLERPLTTVDRALIEAFQHKLIQALISEVEGALDLPVGARAGQSHSDWFQMDVGRSETDRLLRLHLPAQSLAPMRRRFLPARAAAGPLAPLAAALAGRTIDLEAAAGHVSLSLAELRALEPGDVLVLEAPISRGAEIRAAGQGAVLGRGKLCDVEGFVAIKLEAGLT